LVGNLWAKRKVRQIEGPPKNLGEFESLIAKFDKGIKNAPSPIMVAT